MRPPAARGAPRVVCFALPKPLALEGPGSGNRHYPEELNQQFDTRRRSDEQHHDMMSTEDCYRLFPLITHASTPLTIQDHEPAGLSAQRISDAGPSTGRRRRPAPADSPTSAQRQLVPYPDRRGLSDLKRELLARHSPEVLLAQAQLAQQRRPEA